MIRKIKKLIEEYDPIGDCMMSVLKGLATAISIPTIIGLGFYGIKLNEELSSETILSQKHVPEIGYVTRKRTLDKGLFGSRFPSSGVETDFYWITRDLISLDKEWPTSKESGFLDYIIDYEGDKTPDIWYASNSDIRDYNIFEERTRLKKIAKAFEH